MALPLALRPTHVLCTVPISEPFQATQPSCWELGSQPRVTGSPVWPLRQESWEEGPCSLALLTQGA